MSARISTPPSPPRAGGKDLGEWVAAASFFAVAAAAAYVLKSFYSTASAADLRFVLAPTTWLVELAGGHRFTFTPEGYLSTELDYLIAPACAGVNFLIVAFSTLVLGFVRPVRSPGQNAATLLASAAAAYVTTILANALRILLAIPLWLHRVAWGWLTAERVHEVLGVVVFLGMLILLHAAARRVAGVPVRAWLPLLPYLGVMVVVPLLRGAHQRTGFWVHAGIIAGVLLLAALVPLGARHARPRVVHDATPARHEGRCAGISELSPVRR